MIYASKSVYRALVVSAVAGFTDWRGVSARRVGSQWDPYPVLSRRTQNNDQPLPKKAAAARWARRKD